MLLNCLNKLSKVCAAYSVPLLHLKATGRDEHPSHHRYYRSKYFTCTHTCSSHTRHAVAMVIIPWTTKAFEAAGTFHTVTQLLWEQLGFVLGSLAPRVCTLKHCVLRQHPDMMHSTRLVCSKSLADVVSCRGLSVLTRSHIEILSTLPNIQGWDFKDMIRW